MELVAGDGHIDHLHLLESLAGVERSRWEDNVYSGEQKILSCPPTCGSLVSFRTDPGVWGVGIVAPQACGDRLQCCLDVAEVDKCVDRKPWII